MHERRDNVLGTDVLGNFRLALECANLNFPTLETFEMALMRSFKLLLTLIRGFEESLEYPITDRSIRGFLVRSWMIDAAPQAMLCLFCIVVDSSIMEL